MSDSLYSSDRLKRLYYLSTHRGCKETDFILGRFADKTLPHLTDAEYDLYDALLQENDWDIYGWVTNTIPIPEKYNHSLITKIKESL